MVAKPTAKQVAAVRELGLNVLRTDPIAYLQSDIGKLAELMVELQARITELEAKKGKSK